MILPLPAPSRNEKNLECLSKACISNKWVGEGWSSVHSRVSELLQPVSFERRNFFVIQRNADGIFYASKFRTSGIRPSPPPPVPWMD